MSNKKPKPKTELEKRSPRGAVPTSSFGRLDETYNSYLEELDPRGNGPITRDLHTALAQSKDKRFNAFLNCLGDGRMKRWTFAAIAKRCDISLPEFAEFWQSAQKMRVLARAQEGLVKVTDDLVKDALSKQVPCERCDGFGYLEVNGVNIAGGALNGIVQLPTGQYIRSCPSCEGTGFVTGIGDVNARKMLLDMTGMSQKNAPLVNINQTISGSGNSIESATDRLNKISYYDVVDTQSEVVDD